MKTGVGSVVATSALMILIYFVDVRFCGFAGIATARPGISHPVELPAAFSDRFVPGFDRQFLSNIQTGFVLPAPDDELGTRLLGEYGAAAVAGNGVTAAPSIMFADDGEVARFQQTLETSGFYGLQSAAARALAAAQGRAKSEGLSISPSDLDAAGRGFRHSVQLWKSRVDRALGHWAGEGRISRQSAARLRALRPREQAIEILRLEREGLFFGPGFEKSILSSAAPPGASQHLALLAFDVREHREARVRAILEEHGWYQTVRRDAPHFTYLGIHRSRLESVGLTSVKDGEREYWIPRRVPGAIEPPARVSRDAQSPSSTVEYQPGIESVEVFGHSRKGRELVAHIFGEGPNVTMIFGAFHQDEPASAGMVEALRSYLAADSREWEGSTVVLVPRTNPDGALLHERTNANGVDLNRNFPGTWSPVSIDPRYNPGPAAASEPETRALIRLVEKYAPSKIISIHQPFRCLNWDGEAGRMLAEEMRRYNGYPAVRDIGYPTPGSFGSYCARKGIAMVTLEMPSAKLPACWRQNKEALLAAIRMRVPPRATFTLLSGF